MILLTIGLILLSVALGSVAQIFYKKGLKGKLKKINLKELIKVFMSKKILIGLFLYFCSAIIYIYALSTTQLSFAYPIFSSSYAVVTFLSWWLLKEKISKKRLIGVLIVIAGVITVGLS